MEMLNLLHEYEELSNAILLVFLVTITYIPRAQYSAMGLFASPIYRRQ